MSNMEYSDKQTRNGDRLVDKISCKIEGWFVGRGDEFVLCFKEFCQGNRASLTPLIAMVEELGREVFADGGNLNEELQELLEIRIFDLIGNYSSTPGGDDLLRAISDNIIADLADLFAESKRTWNLNHYKITESVNIIDPDNNLITKDSLHSCDKQELEPAILPGDARRQARDIIDRLVLFAKEKFHGEKNRKIAINWLENPDRASDIRWLSSLVGSSKGSTKVTLTRIKKSLAKHHNLKRDGERLILDRVPVPVRRNGQSP